MGQRVRALDGTSSRYRFLLQDQQTRKPFGAYAPHHWPATELVASFRETETEGNAVAPSVRG